MNLSSLAEYQTAYFGLALFCYLGGVVLVAYTFYRQHKIATRLRKRLVSMQSGTGSGIGSTQTSPAVSTGSKIE